MKRRDMMSENAVILLGNTSVGTYILIAVIAGIVVLGTIIAGLVTRRKKK